MNSGRRDLRSPSVRISGKGLKKMRLAFGEYFTPAFVPPYHGYDERTLQVLHEEGFQVFSAGSSPGKEKKRL